MSLVRTINPATEDVLAEFSFDSDEDVARAVTESEEAFNNWRKLKFETRLACVEQLEAAMQSARLSLGELITREMGKTLRESLSEIDKCIASCKTLRERFPVWRKEFSYSMPDGYAVSREPLGVVLGIMPWNFPLWRIVETRPEHLGSGGVYRDFIQASVP